MTDSDLLQGSDLSVLEGRDGWLFVKQIAGVDSLLFHTDDHALADSVYARWVAVLRHRREHFAREGIAYVTLAVPDACVVYPDKLPVDIRLTDRSPITRLAALLDEPTRQQLVYPLQALTDGRRRHETFQSVDSHWTDWGAWLGYLETMHALQSSGLGMRILESADLAWSSRPVFGALGAMMTPERSVILPVAKIKRPAAHVTQRVTTETRRSYTVIEQDAPDLPVAMIYRDSFMNAPAKFFSESFRRTILVSSPNAIFYDLLERERPDVVIHEFAELGLVHLPDGPSHADFRWMFGDLLLDDPLAVADQRKSRSLLKTGRFDDALTASDDVLARVRPNARLMVHRARLHLALGRLDAAIEALRHATSLDVTDGSPWFFLAQALLQKQRLPEAVAAFERATAIEPRHADFWPPAITATLQTGDPARACALSERGSALHPNNPALAHAQSCVLVALERLEEAEAASRRAIALEPASPAHRQHLARVLIRRGNWQEARFCLDEVTRLAPGDSTTAALLDYIDRHSGAAMTAGESDSTDDRGEV